MEHSETDIIHYDASGTLDGLFRERLRRTPDAVAYLRYRAESDDWAPISWEQVGYDVRRWQAAFNCESLSPGDRVAIILRNTYEWVLFDQAALGLGLVVVPLFCNDRAENIAYILNDAGAKLLLIENREHWDLLREVKHKLKNLQRIVILEGTDTIGDPLIKNASDWLPAEGGKLHQSSNDPYKLATIVYTSGTTGRPKGVMLSHRNIVWNAWSGLQCITVYPDDLFLSFLPLSHMLERAAGYYLPMMAGAAVAHARSIPLLSEDLLSVRPTVLISVPRIFERVYSRIHEQLEQKPFIARWLFRLAVHVGWGRFLKQQGRGGLLLTGFLWPLLDKAVAGKIRARLGGRLRLAISGGAPLSPTIAQVFIGLGVPIQQGYGLTETSPVISANSLEDNIPDSVGTPLQDVEVRIGDNDELLVRSPGVMLGYWNNHTATAEMIDADGWLHTGDKVSIKDHHIHITGRLKEILVLANGEKVPPADMEGAIMLDPLIDQALVIGEGRAYLAALIVLNPDQWEYVARHHGLDPADPEALGNERVINDIKKRIAGRLSGFPGYAHIHSISAMLEPWTVENGLITPTLKARRGRILDRYSDLIDTVYAGH